jgi:hypothetical protein
MWAWKLAAVSQRMLYSKSEAVTVLRAKIALSRESAFVYFWRDKSKVIRLNISR